MDKRIWKLVESLIDERVITNMEKYKRDNDCRIEMKLIKEGIEDLAWKIECSMRDELEVER